jgi:hypothetical protein
VLLILCSLLFFVLELAGLVYGVAARRTVLGKVATGISGIFLGISALLMALVITDWVNSGPVGGDFSFLAVLLGVVVVLSLVVSLVLFGLFRANWLR